MARRLPMDFTLAAALGTWLFLWPTVPGLWVFFALGALWTAGDLYVVISATRKLAGTRPEERGKRSDDKALAKAQTGGVGCLGLLVAAGAAGAFLFHEGRGTWPWQPWVVVVGGVLGHLAGIAVIHWSRRFQRQHAPSDPAP